MKLTSHVAIEHNKEDDELNKVLHSTPKSGKGSKESSFVFHESMLDEFLQVKARKRKIAKDQN